MHPTSYNMVKATHKISLTYKQDNLYYNLPGIVRVLSLHKMPAEGHLDDLTTTCRMVF